MTAVRRSERPPTRGLATRALAVLVAVSVAWTPWALVWGEDAMRATGLAGQATGQAAAKAVAVPQMQGETLIMPGGHNLSVQALFPDSGGDGGAFTQWYGDDAAVIGNGRAAQSRLVQGDSPDANAYQALERAVGRARPDMRNDPLWRQTDRVIDTFEVLAQSFADCNNTVTFTQSERQTHIQDLHTCERVVESGNCSWFHDYSLPPASVFVTAWGGATVSDCGAGCAQVSYHHANELVGYGKQYPPALPGQTFGFSVVDPMRVNTVSVSLSPQDPAIQFETQRNDWPLRADHLFYQYSAVFPGYAYSDSSTADWDMINRPNVTLNATADLRSGGTFTLVNNLQAHNDGSNIWYSGSWQYDVTVTVYYTPVNRPAMDWGWTQNEPCRAHVANLQAGGCSGSIQCLGAPVLAANGCYQDTGVQVCPGDLAQPPIAASPFCREIRVTSDCTTVNTGAMECWTDTQGTVQCPHNNGSATNCTDLEQNPDCAFLREQCLEGGERNGICYVHEEVWDCGALASLPTLKRTSSLDCAGPVRCMGGDCLDPASEQSQDFAAAVAALQAAQMAVSDADCTDVAQCKVFPGDGHACKKAVAGIVNCCTTPGGVSLTEYLTLIMAVSKIDSALMGLDKGSTIRGGWETLRQPLDSTWTAVKDGFTSVANNLMGQAAPQVNDALAQLSLDSFKQQLLHATAQWAADTFGPSAVNALFVTESGGAAVDAGGQVVQGVLKLGGPIGTALMYVMYAYMIYAVVMILIKIIWTCEKAEFELGAKRALKSCHSVGSYCKSKVLGWCVEKREAYCCFNTPLARIMNEQIRPQIGRDWGSAKQPECSGIAIADFARVDWTRVNLDEWLAILLETGQFPTLDRLNMAALTGTGSTLDADGNRLDAAQRTTKRSDGIDAAAVRQQAETEWWTNTLPTLPGTP